MRTTFISRRKENEPFLHKGTDDTKELKQLFEKRFQIIQYNKIFVLSLTHLTAFALFGSAKFLKKDFYLPLLRGKILILEQTRNH